MGIPKSLPSLSMPLSLNGTPVYVLDATATGNNQYRSFDNLDTTFGFNISDFASSLDLGANANNNFNLGTFDFGLDNNFDLSDPLGLTENNDFFNIGLNDVFAPTNNLPDLGLNLNDVFSGTNLPPMMDFTALDPTNFIENSGLELPDLNNLPAMDLTSLLNDYVNSMSVITGLTQSLYGLNLSSAVNIGMRAFQGMY